jgi:hypothetical protein
VGRGAVNIMLRRGDDVVKKTGAIAFEVKASLPPARGPMPDIVESWTEAAQALLDRVSGQVLELIFNNATSELTLKGANTVLLNRGLTNAQYNHLCEIMARPYGTWVLIRGEAYYNEAGRDVDDRKKIRVEWGLGILHLDFYAAKTSGVIGTIPAPTPEKLSPKAEVLIEVQTHDGATVWIDPNTRVVKGQAMIVGERYLLNLIGFFIH